MKGATTAMKKQKILKKAAPKLRFSPTAWAKLLFLRDLGDTEIGAFGIASADDLLLVEDIRLVQQTCSWVHVEFDDEAVADFFDEQVDRGLRPEQFGRLWIHTHPGSSPDPSGTDEATFSRVFGSSHWAVMFILARGGQSYCRLRFNVGPGGEMLISADVDYGNEFSASDHSSWRLEYEATVQLQQEVVQPSISNVNSVRKPASTEALDEGWYDAWSEYTHEDHPWEEEPYGFIRDFS
jgi:proteasome lid subunit RPN8/RPN11